jgi:hypothetical protein
MAQLMDITGANRELTRFHGQRASTTSAKNAKILDMFELDMAHAGQFRRHYEPHWYENMRGYLNKRTRPKIPNQYWTKQTRQPDEFRVIETIVPQHILGMFNSSQWFSVTARTGPGPIYEALVKELLSGGWRRDNMFTTTIDAVKYALITGHAILKTYWDVQVDDVESVQFDPENTAADGEGFSAAISRETRQKLTKFGPATYLVELTNYWEDPTGGGTYAIEKIPGKSKGRLQYDNKQYSGRLYDETELSRVKVGRTARTYPYGIGAGTPHPASPWDSASLMEYVEGVPTQRDYDGVDMYHYWKWVHPDDHTYDDGTQWRLIVIINREQVIRDVPAPTPDRRHPYYHVKAIPVPHRFYGMSVLDPVLDIIEQRHWLEDARFEEVAQKLWQPMIVQEHANISPDDLFRRPGGMLWVGSHTGRVQDSIMPLPQQDVMQSSYSESAVKEDQINRATGATDPFSGQAAGGRTTATEATIVAQLGSSRFSLATMWFDESMKRQSLERMFKLYQSRMDQSDILQLAGDPTKRYELDMRDLLWDIDIVVDSGKLGSIDQNLMNAYLQLYQIFASNPVANQYLNHGEVIRDAFMRAGDPNVERHVRSQEDVAREQAQMAEQQRQLQEEQIGQQAGLDTNKELARGFASALASGGGGESQAGGVQAGF